MHALTTSFVCLQSLLSITGAIELTCETANPLVQSNVTCVCRRTSGAGIDWFLNDVLHSNCLLSLVCIPQHSGYTYKINKTENVFDITIHSYSYSDCTKVSCKDANNGTIERSIVPSSIIFDTTYPTSLTEPASNNEDGVISVTTGCISGFSDVKYKWYIIMDGLEEEYSPDKSTVINTTDTSTCSNCNTDNNGKRTIGFNHIEASGDGTKNVSFKVKLLHASSSAPLNVTSNNFYSIKLKSSSKTENDNKIGSIIGGSIGGFVGLCILVAIIVFGIKCYNKKSKVAPETPTGFSFDAESVTNNRVKLIWKQGQNGGSKQTFVVSWHLEGEKKKTSRIEESNENDRTYLLQGLLESKCYTVEIYAENSAGKSQVANPIHITTLGKPETPTDFKYEPDSVTSDSVKLLWKQGHNGGCEQKFVVCWHSNDEKEKSKAISESKKTDREYLLKGLSEAKKYTVKIFSKNDFGNSKEAIPIYVQTLGTPETPRDFKYDPGSVTSNSVKLLWKQGHDGGCTQTFVVSWHSDGKEESKAIQESTKTDIVYLLEGLSEGKKYTVKIFSENNVGKSQEANPIYIRTLGISKPDEPTMFRCSTVTKKSITVQWVTGFDGGDPQTFVLSCLNIKDGKGETTYSEASKTKSMKYEFINLTEDSTYKCSIYAKNSKGNSEQQELIQRTHCVPSLPKDFDVKEIKTTSIKVKWTPGYNGGTQQRFVLKCSGNQKNYTKNVTDNGKKSEMTCEFEKLSKGTYYNISIEATSDEGTSPISGLDVRTRGPPESPSDVQVVELQKTSVTIKWKPGENGGFPQRFILVCLYNDKEVTKPEYTPDDHHKYIEGYLTHTFNKLDECTKYALRIIAENDEGKSEDCIKLVRTKGLPKI